MNNRILYLDSLRALATVAVIAIHVASNNWYGFVGTTDWIIFTIYSGLCKFCVPVFFMISGVLFLNPKRELSIKRLYTHNILKLVLFLIIWSYIYLIFHIIENGGSITVFSIFDCTKEILKGNTQIHFWFIYVLIGIYIISPIIKVFTDNTNRRTIEYFLLLWIIIQSVFATLSQASFIAPIFNNIDKMMIQVTASYLGYFVLGHYLNTYKLNAKSEKCIYILGLIGITSSIILTIYLSMTYGTPNESCFGYFFPGVILYSTAVFLLFKNRTPILERCKTIQSTHSRHQWLQLITSATSKYSLGIYGIHMLFIFILWDIGFSTFTLPSIISVPIIVILVYIASTFSTWILSKIPIINKFVV